MEFVREPVDHRDRRMPGELLEIRLAVRAHDDGVEVAREDEGRVPDSLAASELELTCRQRDGGAAELRHTGREGDPRPGRGLVEDHPERPRRQQWRGRASLWRRLSSAASASSVSSSSADQSSTRRKSRPFRSVGTSICVGIVAAGHSTAWPARARRLGDGARGRPLAYTVAAPATFSARTARSSSPRVTSSASSSASMPWPSCQSSRSRLPALRLVNQAVPNSSRS